MPLSISIAFKLNFSDSVLFRRGDTEIQLGQIKQEVRKGDRLVDELIKDNRRLVEANEKAQRAARVRNVRLPELEEVADAAKDSQLLAQELEENNEELKDIIYEQPPIKPIIK